MSKYEVKLIPGFEDNYFFVIFDQLHKSAVVVDPGESESIIEFLQQNKLNLVAIFLTHQHSDHVDGVSGLLKWADSQSFMPDVYGPEIILKHVPQINKTLNGNKDEVINVMGLDWHVMNIQGHTLGHLGYYCPRQNWLFSGDVLFGMGCGRIFEGTYEMAFESLSNIKSLPDDTQVFCAHEYTTVNLYFSQHLREIDLMPKTQSEELFLAHRRAVAQLRSQNKPSVPLSLQTEKQLNPFLLTSDLSEFKRIRELRNKYRGP